MTERLTMADIGRIAGVSTSTVSRALNNHPTIPEHTRQRILQIATDNNYQVNLQARNLRLQRSKTIATVFSYSGESHRLISDPFFLEIIGAITDELGKYGYDMILSRVSTFDDEWCQNYIMNKRIDGIIIVDRGMIDSGINALLAMDANFVVWGAPLEDQGYISVGCDSFEGGRQSALHLANLGRRKIGFIGGEESKVSSTIRHDGYRAGLVEAGLDYDPSIVKFTDFTQEAAHEAVDEMLEAAPDLDAIFLCSDFMAVAILEVLRASGRRVPEDVSIVGYDDITLAAYCSPRLTTVRQDLRKGGHLLVQNLFAMMNGEEPQTVKMPIELVVRDSCGASLVTAHLGD